MQRKRERCCICRRSFVAHTKVGVRQKTCGSRDCQRSRKKANNAEWRRNNPAYVKNDYTRIKACLEKHPGYLKRYRQDHPEYVQKNREAQRRRDRSRRLNLDIQAKLDHQQAEIMKQISIIPPPCSRLDIQAEFSLKQYEITCLLSRFACLPCLDIQAKMDFTAVLPDNGADRCRMAQQKS